MADLKAAERTHPKYDDNSGVWELYYDAAKGGDNFINSNNLFSHRLEDGEDFDQRLDRAYFLNYCDTLPQIYNTYIFKSNVERSPDDNLSLFRNNTDGISTPIAEFVKKAGYLASVFGVMHCLVDITESNKKSPTLADFKAEGVQPYCSLVYPTQLKDWSVDSKGNFNWVIIEYEYHNDLDPKKERETVTHYKVITKEEWWIEDEDGNKAKFEDDTESSGTNPLGIVPMVTMYHKDMEDDKVGESLLKDIVFINRAIFNWCSCIDEQIARQAFSQLIMPDDGTLAEDAEKGADPLTQISTSSGFLFPSDAKHPPSYISPDVEQMTTIWKLVQDHVKEMFRLAGLQGGTSDLYTSRSGRQSQMSFMGVNSALSEKASTYQKFENDISMLAYLLLGQDPSNYVPVRYPNEFDVVALAEEIDSLFRIMERNFSVRLNKTIQKNIAQKALPLATNDVKKEIEDEIESGDGIVNPIANPGIQPEAKGDGNPNTDLEKSFMDKDTVEKQQKGKQAQEE